LPWYKENPLFNPYDNYRKNGFLSNYSSISKIIKEYTLEMYHIIPKNNEFHLIKKDTTDPNIHFWKNIYSTWEQDTFEVFDRILHKDKVCIDIGGWIGTTSIYSSRKSKHVYVVEADRSSYNDLSRNCAINSNNITCINKAIYNIDNTDIYFGKNKFMANSKENDSTSQIYSTNDTIDNDCYIVKTITLASLCKEYAINTEEVSLVKVDIEGGEENILEDLFQFHRTTTTPLYVSFHYSWWKDKNLSRFPFLTESHKEQILQNPFISILFGG
jgi:FkbM family methyltransferase